VILFPLRDSLPLKKKMISRLRIQLAILALLSCAVFLAGCDIDYLTRGAYAEARVLWNRRPINNLMTRRDLSPEMREKLALVLKVREFARDDLGLNVGGAYTSVSAVDSSAITWVLMAAQQDSLTPYEWWFPIVGWVPYRGYFDKSRARAEAAKLKAQQLDTFLRGAVAFSSLGFFDDPLLSNLLDLDPVVLTGVLIHELFHRTYFLASNVMFDESAANYVGTRGAIEFFAKTEGPTAKDTLRAREVLESQLKFGRFLRDEEAALLKLYGSKLPRAEILRRRGPLFERIKSDYAQLKPSLSGLERYSLDREPLNNAVFINYRIYFHDLDDFAALERLHQGDARATIEEIIRLAKSNPGDPFFAIWQAAQSAPQAPHPISLPATP
jgi:predicted aminopeptidase